MLKKTFNKLKTPTLSIETETSNDDLQDIEFESKSSIDQDPIVIGSQYKESNKTSSRIQTSKCCQTKKLSTITRRKKI